MNDYSIIRCFIHLMNKTREKVYSQQSYLILADGNNFDTKRHKNKKQLRISQLLSVDQPGLEPGTSRL